MGHAIARVVAALGLAVLLAGGALADPLGDAAAELARRTRAYQESLVRLLALQEEAAERGQAEAQRYRELLDRGLVSRRDAESAERGADEARRRVADTRARMAGAGHMLAEAEALRRLAALPPIPPGTVRETPEVVEHAGASPWTLGQVASLERFFDERFGRPLPVSALGQTPVHDRLGFDHRNALDVALHPDSSEGRALLGHLRSRGVPFLAFRGAVAGASTGAHVHVGPPSPRKL